MSNQVSVEVLSAAQNPQATQHSNRLGKILATVLLGLKDGMAAVGSPISVSFDIADFISGFTQIWFGEPTTPPNKDVPAPAPSQPAPAGPAPSPTPINPGGNTQIPA